MDDLMIIELYFDRDERAIYETDVKYGKLCFQIAHNILFNNEDSEECVNDTYMKTWGAIPPTRPNSFRAFLCKITRNLSLKKLSYHLASKRNRDMTQSLEQLSEVMADTSVVTEQEYADLGKTISNFLRNEDKTVRNVFVRKYWFMDSIEDIAKRYSFSKSKVKSMLFQCRIRLKEYLRKEGIEI